VSVVFVPYSARGHVSPMLTVAAELAARGVPVRMVAGQRYAGAIAAAGVTPLGTVPDHDVRVPASVRIPDLVDRARVRAGRRRAWRATDQLCRAELLAERPALMVVDPMVQWAVALGRSLGVRSVPFFTTHVRAPRRVRTALVNSMPPLQPGWERFGDGVRFVGPLVGGITTPDPGVPWERIARRRVLLVSPGTVFARPREFFLGIANRFADTEWTVIMATGHLHRGELGRLPDNVLAFRWVPQLELLRHADVLLTHGGMNSVQEAIVAGVPMVVLPRIGEQRRTARLVHLLGLGERRDDGSVFRQVERVAADPAMARRVASMRRMAVGLPGASAAADLLLSLGAAC